MALRQFFDIVRPVETPAQPLPHYFGMIDLIRFVAAMAIVLRHYPLFFQQGSNAEAWARSPIDPTYLATDLAVPLFWAISGFVFLFQYRERPVSAGAFAWRRFARLYPLHLVTLLLVTGLQFLALASYGYPLFRGNFDLYHFFLNLGFVSGWGFENGVSFNGPVWSVSVELLIYALFFLVLPLLRANILAAAGLGVICFGLYTMVDTHMALLCGTYFFIGCLCFEAARHLKAGGLALVAGAALLCAGTDFTLGVTEVLTFKKAALFTAILCLAAAFDMRFPGVMPGPKSVWNLGNYSYAVYLMHTPIMLAIAVGAWTVVGRDRSIYEHPLTLALTLILTLAVSVAVFWRFELPAKRWIYGLSKSSLLRSA